MHCLEKSLAERVEAWEFHPEIYIYPTPRMYQPLESFSPHDWELSEQLNVYVHVPFCRQFCTFCGYFKTVYDEGLQERFVEAVVGEIALRAGSLRGHAVRTLHFGGGTPSLLTAAQLQRIVEALQRESPRLLHDCLEVSIEATPESVEKEKFTGYHRAGIRRVSMGVQSLVDAEVMLANRCAIKEHGGAYQSLRQAMETLREIGYEELVIDLMIGIEGQTVATFEETLEKALTLRPRTVQLYALGVMPQTGLGRRQPASLLPGVAIYRCYEIARAVFEHAGYRRDSHDRYTLHPVNGFIQGDDNIRGRSLLGFGAGARSYAQRVHYRNSYSALNGRKALLTYIDNIAAGRHSVECGIVLDDEERMRQYAIGHLSSLDGREFFRRFGVEFEQRFATLYQEALGLELLERDGPRIALTERGLLFRDLLARQLFSLQADQLERSYRS